MDRMDGRMRAVRRTVSWREPERTAPSTLPARRPESGVSGWSQVGARRSTTRYFCICSSMSVQSAHQGTPDRVGVGEGSLRTLNNNCQLNAGN